VRTTFNGSIDNNVSLGSTTDRPPSWLIFVLFTALGSFGYKLWFTASHFIAAEKKAESYYVEYAFPIPGLWFGFVGAWLLQPQINRVFDNESGT
jgi:hypothetical protein